MTPVPPEPAELCESLRGMASGGVEAGGLSWNLRFMTVEGTPSGEDKVILPSADH